MGKADISSRSYAESSGRTFSLGGGSRSSPGASQRSQRIVKEWVGNAQEDQAVRCLPVEDVDRLGFRGGRIYTALARNSTIVSVHFVVYR